MAERELLRPFFGESFEPLMSPQPGTQLFHYVKNPDGHIRWVFPDTCRAATLLALYNSAGWRGKLVSTAIRTAFMLRKPELIASGSFWWNAKAVQTDPDFAIFTGTIGVNRKLVVSHGRQFFEKIPCTSDAAWLLKHEHRGLDLLASFGLQKIRIPSAERTSRGGLLLSNIRPENIRPAAELTDLHRAALHELAFRTGHSVRLAETLFHQKMLKNLRDFDGCPANAFTRKMIPLRALLAAELTNIDPAGRLTVGLAHGDFTPWNCFLPATSSSGENAQKLAVYDWEMFLSDAPMAFDALHFTVQSDILLRRLSFEKLLAGAEKTAIEFSDSPGLALRLYVLFTASYYLSRYARQPELHRQVWWLTEAWERILRSTRLPLALETSSEPVG